MCFIQLIKNLHTKSVKEKKRKNLLKKLDAQDILLAKLEKSGHICVKILESLPAKINWCHQEPCAGISW